MIKELIELGLITEEAKSFMELINKMNLKSKEEIENEIESDPFWHEGGISLSDALTLAKDN
jgi:hypothetical protein